MSLEPGPGPRTDTGIEVYPEGLLQMAQRVWRRYQLPITVTENGVADATGELRPEYLRSHLYAVAEANRQGIPINGYFHWSLMDNFEWAEGYEYRFGLYRVDYETYARTPGVAVDEFRRLAELLGSE